MPMPPFISDTAAALLSDLTGGRTDVAAREATGEEPGAPRSSQAELLAKILPFLLLGGGVSGASRMMGRDTGKRGAAEALRDQERALLRLEKIALPQAQTELGLTRLGGYQPDAMARLRAASDQLETAAARAAPVEASAGPGLGERVAAPFLRYGAGPAAYLGGEEIGESNPGLGEALKLGGGALMLGAGAPTAYRRGVSQGEQAMLKESEALKVTGRGIRDEHALSQIPASLNREPLPAVAGLREGIRHALENGPAVRARAADEKKIEALLRRQKAEAETAAAQRYADAGATLGRTAQGWERESVATRTQRLREAQQRINASRELVRTTAPAQDAIRQLRAALEGIDGKRARARALREAVPEFNREHGTSFTWKTLRQEMNKWSK